MEASDWTAASATALAVWLTLGVLAGALWLAYRQVSEAVRLRAAHTRPFVVVDFEAEGMLIDLTVENVGILAAKDVRLNFDPPMRSVRDDPWPPAGSTLLTHGIPTLPPRKRYRFFLDSLPERVHANLPLTYEVLVTYRADDRREPFHEIFTIDLAFLRGLGEAQRKTTHDVANELAEIGKHVRMWTDSQNGPRVDASDDDVEERESALVRAYQRVLTKLGRR